MLLVRFVSATRGVRVLMASARSKVRRVTDTSCHVDALNGGVVTLDDASCAILASPYLI